MNKEITEKLIAFRNARNWQEHHTPEELARSLMIEAAELNRLFQWPLMNRQYTPEQIADELSDIDIYLTYLYEYFGINRDYAVGRKITKNAIKYPVG